MAHRVCPWWLGYFLASPLRKWLFRTSPEQFLRPYVRPGMTVLEPGPGMGFFTLELARLVGPSGRVIALDVQSRMIAKLKQRLSKNGLLVRVNARTVPANSLELEKQAGTVDFTLAFAVVHEMPDSKSFFTQVGAASKSGATLLLAEPEGHVKAEEFASELEEAAQAGFRVIERPQVRRSQAALLQKQ
ncbi:MAG TPA: methyltransferase domain-containing protein [Terriglobales bacterium]|nr:methyltransferase domain-containing protein [Terriglobales bacterium]